MSDGNVSRSTVRNDSVNSLRPGCAGSDGRTIMPVSSIHTPFGTFTKPNSSSTTCAESISDGCRGSAASMNGRAASGSTSSATVTISRPRSGWQFMRSACHTGRSKRQPHHDAQATSNTFCPSRLDSLNGLPSAPGSSSSGARAVVSARPPPAVSGPSAHSPVRLRHERHAEPIGEHADVEATVGGAHRSGSGTHTSPLQAPSGLIAQPVRDSNAPASTASSERIISPDYVRRAARVHDPTCKTAVVTAPIGGSCDPGFGAVRDAFAENFAKRGEVGAAICVIVDGVTVVDLAGGWADEARTRPWQADTLVNFYSVGKALIALLALQAVDRGVVDLDDTIASVWPEFAAHGKEHATIRHALCHRAAVPAIGPRLTNVDLADWDRMVAAVAATEPWWDPGTQHAYHTNTYGHLVGEIVRRTTATLPGDALPRARRAARRRHLVRRAGARATALRGCHLGSGRRWTGPSGARPTDVRDVRSTSRSEEASGGGHEVNLDALTGDAHMVMRSYFNPPGYSSVGIVNTPEWRSAQVPSTNGHGTAAGVARVYAALLEPGRLLSPALLAEATSPQSSGWCPVLGEDVTFGLGFKPTVPRRLFGPNPRSFGHFGSGGAVGFADPDAVWHSRT